MCKILKCFSLLCLLFSFSFLGVKSEIKNFELVSGDVLETVPKYVKEHPELKISLLNIDIDFFEANICCLENFYDLVMPGGVILLDNYTHAHGDTKSTDTFFADVGLLELSVLKELNCVLFFGKPIPINQLCIVI